MKHLALIAQLLALAAIARAQAQAPGQLSLEEAVA